MSLELKIKSKHLSVEAKIIRFEENKLRKQLDWLRDHQQSRDLVHQKFMSLKNHRKWDVRNENRATFIARAFIAGKPYSSVELKRKPDYDYKFYQFILPRVVAMVEKYDNRNIPMINYQDPFLGSVKRIKDPEQMGLLKKEILNWINVG